MLRRSIPLARCAILSRPTHRVLLPWLARTDTRQIHQSCPRYQTQAPPARKCQSCGHPLPTPLPACTNCWNLFALPKDITHHELLGIPYGPNPFVVDLPLLKKQFRQAQTICHPDSWASKNPGKGDVAHALSARVNHAYQTLLDPLQRVEYILERYHDPVSETDQVQDPSFMMEIMEARELIDDAESKGPVEHLLEENEDHIADTLHEIEELVGAQDWPPVKAAAIRLRYLQGIRKAAKRWLDNH